MKTVQTIQGVPFQLHIYIVMKYQQMSTFHLRNAGPPNIYNIVGQSQSLSKAS